MASFNLNDAVTVTLTERGAHILNIVNRDRQAALPPAARSEKPIYRAGDVYKNQVWGLMEIFGLHTGLGQQSPFLNAEVTLKGNAVEYTDAYVQELEAKIAALTAPNQVEDAINLLVHTCHSAAYKAGWWHQDVGGDNKLDLKRCITNPLDKLEKFIGKMVFGTKIALVHSEASEAMEGNRKGLMDDKLPQFPMDTVEFADVLIRTFDTAGACNMSLGEAFVAKLAFNAVRPDHKPENRNAEGGKAY